MYERRHQPPLPRHHFVGRLLGHFAGATAIMAGSLGMGMAGYAHYESLPWRDAFLNAAMLLGIRVLDADAVDRTLGSVLKYREDHDVARDEGLAWVAGG